VAGNDEMREFEDGPVVHVEDLLQKLRLTYEINQLFRFLFPHRNFPVQVSLINEGLRAVKPNGVSVLFFCVGTASVMVVHQNNKEPV
jgi:hypothetical protein